MEEIKPVVLKKLNLNNKYYLLQIGIFGQPEFQCGKKHGESLKK